MQPVKSSNIDAISHDPKSNELHVQFKNGGTYVYADVNQRQAFNLTKAGSIGSHLAQHIKPKHTARKA